MLFSYKQFRQVTGLSKKEADSWVQKGIISAKRSGDGRRNIYTFDSMVEGAVAQQLADFASRELLQQMMHKLRVFLVREGIRLAEVSPDLTEPRILVRIHTQKSKELMPGGGVRGVVAYVKRYDPESKWMEKTVFVVVDLNRTVLHVWAAINRVVSE